MNIGGNIRRLRMERELTQEKLAARVGITPQAVSKWEREEGLPDISLLPALAAALGCSSDELLGIGCKQSQEELADIMKRAWDMVFGDRSEESLRHPNPDAGVEYLRAQLQQYPTEWGLRENLASLLGLSLQLGGYDENKLREQLEHYEYIRLNAPDLNSRLGGVVGLVRAYSALGELDKAEAIARELPQSPLTYNNLAIMFLRGDALRGFLRTELVDAMLKIRECVAYMTAGVGKGYQGMERAHLGTLEERLELVELGAGAWELLKGFEWAAVWRSYAAVELWHGAAMLAEEGLPERALDYVERAAEHCRPVPGEKAGYFALRPNASYVGDAEHILPSREALRLVLGAIEQAESEPDDPVHTLIDHPRWGAVAEALRQLEA